MGSFVAESLEYAWRTVEVRKWQVEMPRDENLPRTTDAAYEVTEGREQWSLEGDHTTKELRRWAYH
jgi:hypothetical protein